MRLYFDPMTAVREIERELKEMGIQYKSSSVQNIPGHLDTFELPAYGFQVQEFPAMTISAALLREILKYRTPVVDGDDLVEYVVAETTARAESEIGFIDHARNFQEPIRGNYRLLMNPGAAWVHRPSMWEQFRHPQTGQFEYTYAERMAPQWDKVMENLAKDGSRHGIISFWDGLQIDDADGGLGDWVSGIDLSNTGGQHRVPCSMYYQFMKRGGKVHMTYCMRSCDFINHFAIDLMIALRLQNIVADRLSCQVGTFTMFIGSLHMFAKDLRKDTF